MRDEERTGIVPPSSLIPHPTSLPPQRRGLTIGGRDFPESGGPYIVGVVNLSPESPNKDAVVDGTVGAVTRAGLLAADGAVIVDIGGQSSHFAARLVSPEEELARLLPAIADLKAAGFLVSVDTWEACVVRTAAEAGADVINDSDGFQDPAVIEAIAATGLPVIIPFLNGHTPRATAPFDDRDPLGVMLPWFEAALNRAHRSGVHDVILDPGTGYAQPHLSPEAKEAFQRRVYPDLHRLRTFDRPLFVALPRKPSPATTLELARMIVSSGATFLRAHDAALATRAIRGTRDEG
ncbi:MAG: dihydropteroate synthase [Chloroflexi bacterium]|nr:dihydropteroate synthase [Chloroflexota bacterium]